MTLFEDILNSDHTLRKIEAEALKEKESIKQRAKKQIRTNIGQPKPTYYPKNDIKEIQSTKKIEDEIRRNEINCQLEVERRAIRETNSQIKELLKLPENKQAHEDHIKIKGYELDSDNTYVKNSLKTQEKTQEKPLVSKNFDQSPEIERAQKSFIQQMKEAREKNRDNDRSR